MYTTWRHTGERETIPGFRLGYALLVNGFDLDVDLEETGRWKVLQAVYAPLLAALGVELITVRSNLRDFRLAGAGRGGVIRSFGTALVASALALSPSLGRFYLAGAHGYAQFHPDGSTPTTDHLLSTAGFQSIHDGADVPTRFAKVAVIARWPEALARLRVCSNPGWRSVDTERGVIDNCGALPQVHLDADQPRAAHRTHPFPELSPLSDAREPALGRAAQPAPRGGDTCAKPSRAAAATSRSRSDLRARSGCSSAGCAGSSRAGCTARLPPIRQSHARD